MARARRRGSQWAWPVGTVNAEGYVTIWLSWRASARLISGKRNCLWMSLKLRYRIVQPTSKQMVIPTRPTGVSNGGSMLIPFSTLLLSFSTGPSLMSTSNKCNFWSIYDLGVSNPIIQYSSSYMPASWADDVGDNLCGSIEALGRKRIFRKYVHLCTISPSSSIHINVFFTFLPPCAGSWIPTLIASFSLLASSCSPSTNTLSATGRTSDMLSAAELPT